jgi:hypothetical protein
VCKYADKRSPDLCGYYLLRSEALKEIMRECERQDEKWGKQDHPMRGKTINPYQDELWPSAVSLEHYLGQCRQRICRGNTGWFDILFEEVCEAFLETEPEKQREEMIQAAAVAVQIIECLNRQMEAEREK